MIGRLLLALWAVGVVGCANEGGSPSAPTAPAAGDPLQPGAYQLQVMGVDFEGNPPQPTCMPAGLPPAGKLVRAALTLDRQGGELVGRLVGADANLELRVQDGGPIASGRRVTGSLRGWIADRGTPPASALGVVVTIRATALGDYAVIEGEVPALLPSSIFASAGGAIEFADAQGLSSTCPSVQLALGRSGN